MNLKFSCLSFNELSLVQLYEIMKLRQEVFVVEQSCPYLDADGKDYDSLHLIAVDMDKDNKIVAYTRLLPKGLSYADYCSIGRVVTSNIARKMGLGKKLMLESIKHCKTYFSGQIIKISAQCYLDKFYKDLGFVSTGEQYLEDDIPHQGMIYT